MGQIGQRFVISSCKCFEKVGQAVSVTQMVGVWKLHVDKKRTLFRDIHVQALLLLL